MKEKLQVALLGALAGAVLVYPAEAFSAAKSGLSAFAVSVLPALLPLLMLLLMLVSRVRKGGGALIALSMLCGSPGGARIAAPLCEGRRTALLAAAATGTMSPMFFLGTLNGWAAGTGGLLLSAHLIAAALSGVCLMRGPIAFHTGESQKITIGQAARSAAEAMLIAAACVTLGFVISALLSKVLVNAPPVVHAAAACALEVTGGAKQLCGLGLEREVLLPVLSLACGFGGLSIQMQNAAFLKESGVTIRDLILLGILRGALACGVCRLLILIF